MNKFWIILCLLFSTIPVGAQTNSPQGLYHLEKFTYDDGSEKIPDYDQYKYFSEAATMTIRIIGNNVKMSNQDGNQGLTYTGNTPQGDDGHGTQLFKDKNDNVVLRWYNEDNASSFPAYSFINEIYTNKNNQKEYTNIINILQNTNPNKENLLNGCWKQIGLIKEKNSIPIVYSLNFSGRSLYWIITDNKKFSFVYGDTDREQRMISGGELHECRHTDNKLSQDNANYEIEWLTRSVIKVIFHPEEKDSQYVELWVRSELPRPLKEVFQEP